MFLFLLIFKTWQAWSSGASSLEWPQGKLQMLSCASWCVRLQGYGSPSSRGTGASAIPTNNYKMGKRIQQPRARIVCLSKGALQFAEHLLKLELTPPDFCSS